MIFALLQNFTLANPTQLTAIRGNIFLFFNSIRNQRISNLDMEGSWFQRIIVFCVTRSISVSVESSSFSQFAEFRILINRNLRTDFLKYNHIINDFNLYVKMLRYSQHIILCEANDCEGRHPSFQNSKQRKKIVR